MSTITEEQVRSALAALAAEVPDGVVAHVTNERYRVHTHRTGLVATTAVASVAIAAGTAVALATGHAPAQSHAVIRPPTTRLRTVPVVYVGDSPPLAVRTLPKGFRLAAGKAPVKILRQAPDKSIPEKQFVAGPPDDPTSIFVAEGTDGEGPLPKVQGYAAANPGRANETVIDGTTVTVIQVGFGEFASYIAYFSVSSTSWAIVGGTQGVTSDQLLTVAAGILGGTS